jgi:hypothetical protein
MHIATIFSRAWQQKYLTPAERSLYKFIMALLILTPPAAILSGVAWLLDSLHASVPSWIWQVLAVLVPAGLLALAKYVSAHGDVQVGAIIQQVEAGAVVDIAAANARTVTTRAYVPPVAPRPIVLPPGSSPVPPRASAEKPPSA